MQLIMITVVSIVIIYCWQHLAACSIIASILGNVTVYTIGVLKLEVLYAFYLTILRSEVVWYLLYI